MQLKTIQGFFSSTYGTYSLSDLKHVIRLSDSQKPKLLYVAPLALTNYQKGDEVMLTVIINEPIKTIEGIPALDVSATALGDYFENIEYVESGTGTNTLVFKAIVKNDFDADTAMDINEILVFTEKDGGKFEKKIGILNANISDFLGNTRTE